MARQLQSTGVRNDLSDQMALTCGGLSAMEQLQQNGRLPLMAESDLTLRQCLELDDDFSEPMPAPFLIIGVNEIPDPQPLQTILVASGPAAEAWIGAQNDAIDRQQGHADL